MLYENNRLYTTSPFFHYFFSSVVHFIGMENVIDFALPPRPITL